MRTTNSNPAAPKSRRKMGLRIAAAGFLAAIPMALVALPASAATPDSSDSSVVLQQVDQPGWPGQDQDQDRDHHDRDRNGGDRDRHDGDRDRHDNDNQQPAPAPSLPSTGSFG